MALAGSNGGSWSTTYSLKPTVKPGSESHMPSGEVETGTASNVGFVREYRGRLSIPGNSSPGVGFADRILTTAGDLKLILLFSFIVSIRVVCISSWMFEFGTEDQ